MNVINYCVDVIRLLFTFLYTVFLPFVCLQFYFSNVVYKKALQLVPCYKYIISSNLSLVLRCVYFTT